MWFGLRPRRIVRSVNSQSPRVKPASAKVRRAALEALETRRLLTTVNILATSGDDFIVINATSSDAAQVQVNNVAVGQWSNISQITINGDLGNDKLQINNPTGSIFAPADGILFTGGGQSGDELENLGGSATGGSYTPGATSDAGTITHKQNTLTQTITFSGLAPVTDAILESTFTINGTSAGEHVNVVNGPVVAGNQTVEVNSSPDNTFELIRFAQKTSVTVDAGGGADTVLVDASTAATGLSDLTVTTGGNTGDVLNVGTEVVPGTLLLKNAAGPISDTNGAATNISAAKVGLLAGTGIATAADPLETIAGNIEAESDTGGINISNASPVVIGGVDATLRGLREGTSGDINFTNSGTTLLNDTDGLETIRGGGTSGDVNLTSVGSGALIASTADIDAITASAGNISVQAGGSIAFGIGGPDRDNDVRARGNVTLTAAGSVTIDGFADVAADDFGAATGGNLTINAGGDVNVTDNAGDDASAGASGLNGSDVLITTGLNGVFLLTAPSADAVFSQSGDVTIAADRVKIDAASGITASSGVITIRSVTGSRAIVLGSTTDVAAAVELSDAEMDRLFAPTVRIGDATFGGNISAIAPISGTTYSTLELATGALISGPSSVAVTNLVLTDGGSTGKIYGLNAGSFQMAAAPTPLLYTATTVTLNASTASDVVEVLPSATTTFTINGNSPTGAGTAPGDVLSLISGPSTFLHITSVNGDSKDGSYTFAVDKTINFTSIETLNPGPSVDLSITKTDGVSSAVPGTNITYTITASNAGAVGVNGVTVADIFPTDLTNITWTAAATAGSSVANASGTGDINELVDLASGGSVVYTVTATIKSSAVASLVNTATVTAPANFTDPVSTNNSATDVDTLTSKANLKVTKVGPAFAGANSAIAYTITVTNNGPSDALSASLIDNVPANTTFVSITQDSGPTAFSTTPVMGGTGTIIETMSSLPAGQTAQFTLLVQPSPSLIAGTVISNTAIVTSAAFDPDSSDNSATATTTIHSLVSVSDVTKAEGNSGVTAFTFHVTLSGPAGGIIQVGYSTHDQTATLANNDYEPAIGTLTFLPGQLEQTVTVLVNGDKTFEPNETFTLDLGFINAPGVVAGIGDSQGVGTIVNDDPSPPALPGVSVNDVSTTEGNSGTKNLTFTVKLSKPSSQTITVKYTTADGTAVGGSDYVKQSGTLTFLPGQTTKTVSIQIKGDTVLESDETVLLVLSAPTHAFVSDAIGMGTIRNDDTAPPPPTKPSISVNDVTILEGNSGTKMLTFTVKLSKTSASPVTVKYTTSDGTAKLSDNDYIATSGTLTFAAGQLTKTISVAIKGDTKVEADETLLLALSGPTNATIGDPLGIGTIKNDD